MDEIGARLREARMRTKVDINEVESRTKIRAKYLRAMENDEWDLLPGEVYARSFLRTYAEFLGVDARELLDDFRRRYESPADHEQPPIVPPSRRERRERDPRRRVLPWLVTPAALVVVVLVAVVVVLYFVGTSNTGSHNSTTPPRAARASTGHRHAATRHVVVHRAPATPHVVRLALVPTGAVYVCLVNGAGKILIPGHTYDTGETIPVQRGGKLLLTLGTAAMTIRANGRDVPVAPSANPIGYEFTPTGHSLLPPARQPTCTGG